MLLRTVQWLAQVRHDAQISPDLLQDRHSRFFLQRLRTRCHTRGASEGSTTRLRTRLIQLSHTTHFLTAKLTDLSISAPITAFKALVDFLTFLLRGTYLPSLGILAFLQIYYFIRLVFELDFSSTGKRNKADFWASGASRRQGIEVRGSSCMPEQGKEDL